MRYYKLKIGPNGSLLTLQLDEEHPIAPRITFNIQSVSDANVFVPSIIQIFNLPLAFFTAAKQLLNQELILEAGIKSSPLTSFVGMKTSTHGMIFKNKVTSVVPDFDGRNVNLSLYCADIGSVSNSSSSNNVVEVVVPSGKSMGEGYQSFFQKLLGDLYTVELTTKARGEMKVINSSKTDMKINHSNVFEAIAHMKNYGLCVAINSNVFRIFFEDELEELARAEYRPSPANFITQPTWSKTTSIAVTFSLDGDIQVLKKLKIPDNLLTSVAPLTQAGDTMSTYSTSYGVKSILGGDFLIQTVWHRGDSRGTTAESWVTEIEANTPRSVLSDKVG